MQKTTTKKNIDRVAMHKQDSFKSERGAYRRKAVQKAQKKIFVPDMSSCAGCVHLRSVEITDKSCHYVLDEGKSRFPISLYHEMDKYRGQPNYREIYDKKVNELTRNCPHKKTVEECTPSELYKISHGNRRKINF